MTDPKDFGQDPERLEAQIDVTRSKISEDLRAIGDKLTPENVKHELKEGARHMVSDAKDRAVGKLRDKKDAAVESMTATMGHMGEKARRAGGTTVHFAKDNAAPLALIGLGLTWLLASRRRSREDWRTRQYAAGEWGEQYYPEYTDDDIEYIDDLESNRGKLREGVGRVKERAHDVAATVEHRAHEMKEQAGQKIQHVRERAETKLHQGAERARMMRQRAQHKMHDASVRSREYAQESPLAVGAIAMATGIGVGLLLPATQKEKEVLGPTRDRLVGEVKQAAQQITSTVKDTAREAKSQVSEQLTH